MPYSNKTKALSLILILILAMFCLPTATMAAGTNWSSPTTGNLDGSSITLTNISGPTQSTWDLSTADYSAAPLSTSQAAISYDALSDWTASFTPAITNVRLYLGVWRGIAAGGADPVTYTFNQPFTVLSGLGSATITGQTISVPASGFHNGIIEFTGSVSAVTLNTSASSNSGQLLTFGSATTEPPPPMSDARAIPTLSPIMLVLLTLLLGATAWSFKTWREHK